MSALLTDAATSVYAINDLAQQLVVHTVVDGRPSGL